MNRRDDSRDQGCDSFLGDAMLWDFDISRTLGLMVRTWPFIVTRMVVYFGITLAYMIAVGGGAGVGYGVGNVFGDADTPTSFAFWGGIVGFGVVSGVVYWIREWILYMVKAAHIAVLVHLVEGRDIPGGRSQIDYGQAVVRERFTEANVLFALDQLVKGALRAITGLIGGIAAFLPIPGLDALARFVNAVITMSLTFVDEIVLGLIVRTNAENPFETAKNGVILYGQNAKLMVKNALWLTVIIWALSLLVFLVMLAPAGALVWLYPGSSGGYAFVVAILLAWSVKAALIEPFAIAALMSVYFRAIEGQTPDPVWNRRLSDASRQFRELGEKAVAWVRGGVRAQSISSGTPSS